MFGLLQPSSCLGFVVLIFLFGGYAWFLGPTLVVLWLCLESRLFLPQPSLGFVCFHKKKGFNYKTLKA